MSAEMWQYIKLRNNIHEAEFNGFLTVHHRVELNLSPT
jgi:hypothetical protein